MYRGDYYRLKELDEDIARMQSYLVKIFENLQAIKQTIVILKQESELRLKKSKKIALYINTIASQKIFCILFAYLIRNRYYNWS